MWQVSLSPFLSLSLSCYRILNASLVGLASAEHWSAALGGLGRELSLEKLMIAVFEGHQAKWSVRFVSVDYDDLSSLLRDSHHNLSFI